MVQHALLAAKEANQSKDTPKIVIDEEQNITITASEALKKLHEVKNFTEVNGSDHLNLIFNKLIENVEQIKFNNQKQSVVRSFFRS